MSFFLAVDAGGTTTDYVLANEIHELPRVRTGTIKRMRTDVETAAIGKWSYHLQFDLPTTLHIALTSAIPRETPLR